MCFAPPPSYAQERLWFLEQLEPGMALYNIPYISTVSGAVHRGAFNRAVKPAESSGTSPCGPASSPPAAARSRPSIRSFLWRSVGKT